MSKFSSEQEASFRKVCAAIRAIEEATDQAEAKAKLLAVMDMLFSGDFDYDNLDPDYFQNLLDEEEVSEFVERLEHTFKRMIN